MKSKYFRLNKYLQRTVLVWLIHVRKVTSVMSDSAKLWTVDLQDPLSMGFSRQEYWSGLPSPSPRDLPDPGIEPMSLMSPALAGRFFTTSATCDSGTVNKIIWPINRLCQRMQRSVEAGRNGQSMRLEDTPTLLSVLKIVKIHQVFWG